MLLERSEELRALSTALDEARSGAVTTVWVGGEAGSGKSTLTAHFTATAPCRVLRSGCDGATTAAPLGPLIDIAPTLAVDVPGDAGAPVDRIRVFAATRAALVAEPTVWLVEDLHWADAPTLDLIRYLARRRDAGPVLLLLTFRDDEVGVGHPVRVLLGELATVRGVRRVRVPPLSRAAVADLAGGSGVGQRVEDRSGSAARGLPRDVRQGARQRGRGRLDADGWSSRRWRGSGLLQRDPRSRRRGRRPRALGQPV